MLDQFSYSVLCCVFKLLLRQYRPGFTVVESVTSVIHIGHAPLCSGVITLETVDSSMGVYVISHIACYLAYFVPFLTVIYFVSSVPNPCVTNPCLHGGTCIDTFSKYTGFPRDWDVGYLHYYCMCPQGYSGPKCEGVFC